MSAHRGQDVLKVVFLIEKPLQQNKIKQKQNKKTPPPNTITTKQSKKPKKSPKTQTHQLKKKGATEYNANGAL